MAKKKAKRTVRRPRRRMSGRVGDNMEAAILGIAGGIGANIIVTKLFPTMQNTLKAGGVAVLGMLLPNVIKGKIGEGIGNGLVVGAGIQLAKGFGIISGMDDSVFAGTGHNPLSLISGGVMAEKRNMPVLNGFNDGQTAGSYTKDSSLYAAANGM